MKKVLYILLCILSVVLISGCDNTSNKIVVELRVNELSKKIYLEKGSIITLDVLNDIYKSYVLKLPYSKEENTQLYYDPEFKKIYNGEPINEDIILYQKYTLSEYSEYSQANKYWVSYIYSVYRSNLENIKLQYFKEYVLPKYENATRNNVFFERLLGVYNNCFVSIINDLYTGDVFKGITRKINIAGSEFKYQNTLRIKVYKDGKFYELDEAYENGLLGNEDIKMIEYNYRKCYLQEIDLECPIPTIKYTEEEFLYRRELYFEYIQETQYHPNNKIENLNFEYLDKCNNVEFFVSYEGFLIERHDGEGTYGFTSKYQVFAIINNKVYFIDDAYRAGLLTNEEFECAFESYYNRVLSM